MGAELLLFLWGGLRGCLCVGLSGRRRGQNVCISPPILTNTSSDPSSHRCKHHHHPISSHSRNDRNDRYGGERNDRYGAPRERRERPAGEGGERRQRDPETLLFVGNLAWATSWQVRGRALAGGLSRRGCTLGGVRRGGGWLHQKVYAPAPNTPST